MSEIQIWCSHGMLHLRKRTVSHKGRTSPYFYLLQALAKCHYKDTQTSSCSDARSPSPPSRPRAPGQSLRRTQIGTNAWPWKSPKCYKWPGTGIRGQALIFDNTNPNGSRRVSWQVFALAGGMRLGLRGRDASGQGPQRRVSGRTAVFLPQDFKSTMTPAHL